LEDNGIPELTLEQIAELCESAEQTARTHVLSKVSIGRITTLDVVIDAKGTKPIIVNVDVSVVLSPLMKDYDVKSLTNEATKQAFVHIEECLKELKCKSQKY
jgi:hypothetical protein